MNDLVLVRKNLFRKQLRAILMIVSILVAFLIFGVLGAFYRAFNAGEERGRGRPARRRQQDQLHPAAADRLFQPRAGRRGRAAGDAFQLVRRLLPGARRTS